MFLMSLYRWLLVYDWCFSFIYFLPCSQFSFKLRVSRSRTPRFACQTGNDHVDNFNSPWIGYLWRQLIYYMSFRCTFQTTVNLSVFWSSYSGLIAIYCMSQITPSNWCRTYFCMEEIGGIVLIIGVLTRVASILFIILMIGAIITVQVAKGFIGGYIQYSKCF